MGGFVKIHRQIIDWGWYGDINVRLVFMHLLLKANYKDVQWRDVMVKRGQLVTSIAHLSAGVGISEQQTKTALDKLKSTGEITSKATNKYTIVTILKYGDYQDSEQQSNQQNNQQITNQQQTDNQQVTTSKEGKNSKNSKNERSSIGAKPQRPRFVKPSVEEIQTYCTERNNGIDAQHFFDYYEARGWKLSKGQIVKDWQACVRTWERSGFNSKPTPSVEERGGMGEWIE